MRPWKMNAENKTMTCEQERGMHVELFSLTLKSSKARCMQEEKETSRQDLAPAPTAFQKPCMRTDTFNCKRYESSEAVPREPKTTKDCFRRNPKSMYFFSKINQKHVCDTQTDTLERPMLPQELGGTKKS